MTVFSDSDMFGLMDLEAYRIKHGLTFDDLARLIGVSQAKQARAYALGHDWPQRAERLERIIAACAGEVTLDAMHRRRLEFEQQSAPAA